MAWTKGGVTLALCVTSDMSQCVCASLTLFLFVCSIILTTAQYLSPALHKNFTDADFDFKVRDFHCKIPTQTL